LVSFNRCDCLYFQRNSFNEIIFLIANSVLSSDEKLSKFIDILNEKLVSAKSNIDKAQTSLSKTEKGTMENLINGLHNRVIDVDQRPTVVHVTKEEKITDFHTLPGEISKDHNIRNDNDEKYIEDESNNDKENNLSKKLVDERNLSKIMTTTADEVSLSIKHEYKDFQKNFVRCTNSVPVRFGNSNKFKRFSRMMNSEKRNIRTISSGVTKPLYSPLVLRFAHVINVLDRSDGVDEAMQTLGISTILKNSAVFDVKCPFDKMVGEEALVKSILKKLQS
jgi:hypothetical protein